MNELIDLVEQFEQAYNALSESTWKYRAQAMVVSGAERELDYMKLLAHADGKVEGKNVTEREANEFKLFEETIRSIDSNKDMEADLYMKMELNRLRVDHLRATLRIYEMLFRGLINDGTMD